MKIVLSGGGTLGPVMPLLAITRIYQEKNLSAKFIWVGTKHGVEKEVVEKSGLPFFSISSGKWRRYFSFWNFIDLFKIFIGFWQSIFFLRREKPDLLISAGGFVSVPLHFAAHFLKITCWVHQQDVTLGLANRIMSAFADKVTVANQFCLACFDYKNVELIGNPVRNMPRKSRAEARNFFGIDNIAPVIFVLGGGTGAKNINMAICEVVKKVPRDWHFIHLTGLKRAGGREEETRKNYPNYRFYEFFNEEIGNAFQAANVVVTRGGLGTLTEMSFFKKAGIIVPMTRTHQELNAKIVAENGAGVVVKDSARLAEDLAVSLKKIICDPEIAREMGERLAQVFPIARPEKIISIIDSLAGQKI